ncbi:MAG TPA: DUF5615 family PIN-like protein [Thermodesulfobacteriota bacterium]
MRLLADENFPRVAVDALVARGHDVLWARRAMPGAADSEVLARATAEQRILITFDKDFGELGFRSGLPSSSGIVLFRLSPSSPSRVADVAVLVLESRDDWAGHFSVVEADRVRMTALPGSKGRAER